MDHKSSNTRETLIEELGSLRYTLDGGPEFQYDIPVLNKNCSDQDHPPTDPASSVEADTATLTDIYDDTKALLPKPLSLESPPSDTNAYNTTNEELGLEEEAALEQLLHELNAEQLPKLEEKLRVILHHELETVKTLERNNSIDED